MRNQGKVSTTKALRRVHVFLSVAVLFFVIVLPSCSTSPRHVQRATVRNEFGSARQMLEELGAGEHVDPKLSSKLAEARRVFENAVTSTFVRRADTLLQYGNLEDAVREIDEGLGYCPWSEELRSKHEEIIVRISVVRALERMWFGELTDERATIEEAREFLSRTRAIGSDHAQSVQLTAQRRFALRQMEAYWLSLIEHMSFDAVNDTVVELAQTDLADEEFSVLFGHTGFQTVIDLFATPPELRQQSSVVERVAIAIGTDHATFAMGFLGESIAQRSYQILSEWFDGHLFALFDNPPTLSNISAAERIAAYLGDAQSGRFRDALALFHLKAAERLSGMSTAAMLSFVHLTRSKALSESIPIDSFNRVWAAATRSLVDSDDLFSSIAIDGLATLDPTELQIVRLSLYSDIVSRTASHFHWSLAPIGSTQGDRQITITRIGFYHPDPSRLRAVNSTYHSHNENVANPAKAMLEIRLNIARNNADSAKRSYDWAVSSHNYQRTQFSLNNVNQAYRNYQQAINNYNNLVRQYNATSSTISRPVFLPYTFQEGTVRFGWDIEVEVTDGEESTRYRGRSIVEEFVRIGARATDRNSEYRRNSPLRIRTDSRASLDHLMDATGEIVSNLREFVGRSVRLPYTTGLEEAEVAAVSELLHPWSIASDDSPSIPGWMLHSLGRLEMPDLSARAPRTVISKPSGRFAAAPRNIEDLSLRIRDTTVLLLSGTGQSVSTSSGALIGPNGLILTSAHGLTGRTTVAEVSIEGTVRTFPVDTVFINHRNDVALVHARGLSNRDWLPIRLDGTTDPGEAIVAVGNPSLPDGSFVRSAVSEGRIAAPSDTHWGVPRLVADVTVASGSSGGPIVSQLDGSIVGVVVAIASPEFVNIETGRSASGMFVLAAPANLLSDWLGLAE